MAWLPLRLPPHCKFVVSITCEQGKPDTLENLANLKGQAHEKLDNILSAYLRNCCWYSKAHSRFWALFHRQNASTLIIFSFPVHFTLKIEFFYQVYTITSFWYSSHALLQKQMNVLRCWCTFQCHKFIKNYGNLQVFSNVSHRWGWQISRSCPLMQSLVEAEDHFLLVSALGKELAWTVMKLWMKNAGRDLNNYQWRVVANGSSIFTFLICCRFGEAVVACGMMWWWLTEWCCGSHDGAVAFLWYSGSLDGIVAHYEVQWLTGLCGGSLDDVVAHWMVW